LSPLQSACSRTRLSIRQTSVRLLSSETGLAERLVGFPGDCEKFTPDTDADEDDESESESAADRDIRLEANRIGTEAVANADGHLADFEVFCATVEATQDTLLRTVEA
jgi:hypothetical protein